MSQLNEAIDEVSESPLGYLLHAVAHHPDALWLEFSGDEWSFKRVHDEAIRLANGYRALGIEPGDRVAALLDNSPDAILTWFAANFIGAIHVPINTSYVGDFLRHQLVDAGARLLVVETRYLARLTDIEDELSGTLERVLVRGSVAGDRSPISLCCSPLDDYRRHDGRPRGNRPRADAIALIIYTSGTTGPSKGCALSHGFVCTVARGFQISTGQLPDERNWSCMPLFHLNAVATVTMMLMLGGAVSMVDRFSVSAFWPEMVRTGASVVSLLGGMLPLLAQAPDNPSSVAYTGKLRAIYGVPFPEPLKQIYRERFGVRDLCSSGYGQTECGVAFTLPPGDPDKPSASGRVIEHFEARIVDENDRELPSGVVGEVVLRPSRPNVMFSGYWGNPQATVDAFRNLWYHTGDLGRLDDDGFFYFEDRNKDYLRRRGENISSFEVERALALHPDVLEVAVHAVRSDLSEDEVKATVVRREGANVTEREIWRWCEGRLPRFAIPRFIEFRSEIPKNPVGRTLKYLLRDEGRTGSTWDSARETALASNGRE
jgi:carnitine-CoA ligase